MCKHHECLLDTRLGQIMMTKVFAVGRNETKRNYHTFVFVFLLSSVIQFNFIYYLFLFNFPFHFIETRYYVKQWEMKRKTYPWFLNFAEQIKNSICFECDWFLVDFNGNLASRCTQYCLCANTKPYAICLILIWMGVFGRLAFVALQQFKFWIFFFFFRVQTTQIDKFTWNTHCTSIQIWLTHKLFCRSKCKSRLKILISFEKLNENCETNWNRKTFESVCLFDE